MSLSGWERTPLEVQKVLRTVLLPHSLVTGRKRCFLLQLKELSRASHTLMDGGFSHQHLEKVKRGGGDGLGAGTCWGHISHPPLQGPV